MNQAETNQAGSTHENGDLPVHDLDAEVEQADGLNAIERDRQARLDDLKSLAASGELDAPAGADELVDALADAVRERDDYLGKFQLSVAELENFRRRSRINEQEARDHATRSVVTSLVMSLDTFDLALQQDPERVTVKQIMDGVRTIKDEIIRRLGAHGVATIEPVPGDEFEPGRHEAVTQAPVAGIESGAIGQTLQAGYLLGDRVIRPAKVLISTGEPDS